jgi:hypothetical protein
MKHATILLLIACAADAAEIRSGPRCILTVWGTTGWQYEINRYDSNFNFPTNVFTYTAQTNGSIEFIDWNMPIEFYRYGCFSRRVFGTNFAWQPVMTMRQRFVVVINGRIDERYEVGKCHLPGICENGFTPWIWYSPQTNGLAWFIDEWQFAQNPFLEGTANHRVYEIKTFKR